MNDIEKQIEGVNDEEGVDMNRLNSNNNCLLYTSDAADEL